MERITLVKATLADAERLQTIGRQTFTETFGKHNTEENMKAYLEEGFALGKIQADLADPNAEWYLAISGSNAVAGYLKLNSAASQTELKDDGNAMEIERIYVARDFQEKRVGQQLYEKAVEVATRKQADYLWLGVWEQNSKAIRFYQKNGFIAFDKHTFKLGDDVQTDIMMKRTLPRTAAT